MRCSAETETEKPADVVWAPLVEKVALDCTLQKTAIDSVDKCLFLDEATGSEPHGWRGRARREVPPPCLVLY